MISAANRSRRADFLSRFLVTIMTLELRSFQQRLPDLESRGIHVVAISVDPPEINRAKNKNLATPTHVLSDPKAK